MRRSCSFFTGMTLSLLFAVCLFFKLPQILSTPAESPHPRFKPGSNTLNYAEYDPVEFSFESTLRSCLSSKCFDEPVAGSIKRVGVLSLPGTGVGTFKDLITQKLSKTTDVEVLFDSHVPAYGYGKNHGWTRIIRFARNIIGHAYFLVRLESNGELSADLDKMDAQVN